MIGLAGPCAAFAQVFALTGGSSTLLNAQGGSFEIKGENYTGRIDLGYFGRPSFGFFLLRPYRESLIGAGDQPVSFRLPTDLFDHSFYFLSRGLSVTRKKHGTRLFAFAGATADGLTTPFVNVARLDTPASGLFYETQLSPNLKFFSRNIASRRQTSIQAFEWTAREDTKIAFSAGVGSNQRYWSSSYSYHHNWLSLDASYALAGDAFRRVLVDTPQLAENDRENIRLELAPYSNLRIIASRNNYVMPLGLGPVDRAAVNGFGGWTSVAGQQLYGSLYQSFTASGKSQAIALGTRRTLTRRLEAGIDFLRSGYSAGQPNHSIVGTVREILNSRFSLNQIVTRGNGQTSVSFGGNFVSNIVTASVDYQTVFLPFVQTGPSQFKQVMVLGLHFQLPRGPQLNVTTNVTPLGQVRYTTYASTYAYRAMSSSGTSFSGAFFHNVVRGHVIDPQGQPVAGAALRIAGELTITDSDGNFLVRLKKSGEVALEIALEEFTAPGLYAVVNVPPSIKATREDAAPNYEITVKRVPIPPPHDQPATAAPPQI